MIIRNKQADHIQEYFDNFSNFNTVKHYGLWIQGGDEWERQGTPSEPTIEKQWLQRRNLTSEYLGR